jgi:hypothetical protein
VGRERGSRLVRAASPCDADYEDGSVPLQLPLSCADHCIEARREGCHLREIEWDVILARQIVVRPAPPPSSPAPLAHRLRGSGA